MPSMVPLLAHVDALNASGKALTHEPLRPRVQACLDAGLITLTPMLCGPLRMKTGEFWVRLTDDGKKLLPV